MNSLVTDGRYFPAANYNFLSRSHSVTLMDIRRNSYYIPIQHETLIKMKQNIYSVSFYFIMLATIFGLNGSSSGQYLQKLKNAGAYNMHITVCSCNYSCTSS